MPAPYGPGYPAEDWGCGARVELFGSAPPPPAWPILPAGASILGFRASSITLPDIFPALRLVLPRVSRIHVSHVENSSFSPLM
eukprot:36989-Rhodomonas_salina.4